MNSKVSEQLNEILDRAFTDAEPPFNRRFAEKIGFQLTAQEKVELGELWRIVENANEQTKQFSFVAADTTYRKLVAEQEVRIDSGEPLELLPDKGIFSFQYQSAFATATQGRQRALKNLRNAVRPIASRFAQALQNEAAHVDADHAARAEAYGFRHQASDVAEKLRAEADAVVRQVDTAETLKGMLPWAGI